MAELKRITEGMTGQEAADVIYNNDEALNTDLNGPKQLTNYHFPLICISSNLSGSDIIISKPSNTELKVDFKKELFFYYKTQTGTSNFIRLYAHSFEISIIESRTSIVVLGVIFNPKTSRLDIDSKYSYVLVPDDNFTPPILGDGEVFAPILTISGVTTSNPAMTNGTLFENIIANRGALGEYVAKNSAQITAVNASLGGITLQKTGNTLTVSITQAFIYLFKTVSDYNYLYPPAQNITCKLNAQISSVVIGVVANYKTGTDFSNVRYDWYCTRQDTINTKLVLAENEIFCPVLVVQVLPDVKMTGGTLFDLLNGKTLTLNTYYGYNVELATAITENDFSIAKGTDDQENPTLIVDIKKPLVYNTKLTTTANYVYPPAQNLIIPLVTGRTSIVQIGVIFSPSTLTVPANSRYDYVLSPNVDNIANPVLAEGEVFAPVLTISNVATTSPIMTAGKIYDKLISAKVLTLDSINNKKSNPLVYSIDFRNTDLSEWSNTFINATGGVQLNPNTYYWLKRLYRINKRAFEFDFNTATASKFAVYTHGLENGLAGIDTLFFTVDIANNLLTLSYDNTTLAYTFTANKDYRIRITQNDRVLGIKIIDLANGNESDELTYKGVSSNTGLLYDSLSFYFDTGVSPIFKKFVIYSQVKNPKIIFFGDSITVGYTSTIVDGLSKNGYTQLCGEATGLPYLTSGRGGGTIAGFFGESSYIGRFITELAVLKPNFAMVTIGTNGGASYTDYKKVVDFIQSYGVVPILNNIPLRDGAAYISTTNEAINQIRRDYGISGARFDLATSVNNDGITFDASLFVADKVHPNDAGHLAMFNRVKLDVPEIF